MRCVSRGAGLLPEGVTATVVGGSGPVAVVQTLVNHGADVATETNYGRTALGVARNEEVKAALREREPL